MSDNTKVSIPISGTARWGVVFWLTIIVLFVGDPDIHDGLVALLEKWAQ